MQAKKVGEVEVEPGFSHTQQIGIAMACLIEAGNQRFVDFVKDVSVAVVPVPRDHVADFAVEDVSNSPSLQRLGPRLF